MKMLTIALMLSGLFLLSCGGGGDSTVKSGDIDYPEWYGITKVDKVNFYGIGSTKFHGDLELARQTAIAKAKQDLAGQIKTFVLGKARFWAQQATKGNAEQQKALFEGFEKYFGDNLIAQSIHNTAVDKFKVVGDTIFVRVVAPKEDVVNASKKSMMSKTEFTEVTNKANADVDDLWNEIKSATK